MLPFAHLGLGLDIQGFEMKLEILDCSLISIYSVQDDYSYNDGYIYCGHFTTPYMTYATST